MIKTILTLLMAVCIPLSTIASSFSGGSASFVTKASRQPNIIFIMLDEVGREQYPQLLSPYTNSAGQLSFTGSGLADGNIYPLQTATDFPNLNLLLENGINFTGMWSGTFCGATRYMLATGNPGTGGTNFAIDGRISPMTHVNQMTDRAYKIAHYGKSMMGCNAGFIPCSPVSSGTSMSIDNTNDAPPGGGVGGGGYAWRNFGPTSQSGVIRPLPVSDSQLWSPTVDGVPNTQVMYQDESGLIDVKRHVQSDQSASGLSFSELNWFANQTGQPFIITYSPFTAHGGQGSFCTQLRTAANGYVLPTTDVQAGAYLDEPFPPLGPTPNYGPSTSPNYTDVRDDPAAGGRGSWRIWYDCLMSELRWVDDEIGKILAWLGPHGLNNTLIVFTGDNGSPAEQIANHTGFWGPGAATVVATPATSLFDMSLSEDGFVAADTPANGVIVSGKGAYGETGLNVPFVMAYGRIPQRLRGTNSATRLTFADVAETTLQLITPNSVGTGYYPEGRDFTPLIYGTAADQDTLFGTDVTVASDGTKSPPGVAAAMNPDSSGNIYRMMKHPSASNLCAYVQDLSRVDFETNLRGDTTPEVVAAIADMEAAIVAAFPLTPTMWDEPATCLPAI